MDGIAILLFIVSLVTFATSLFLIWIQDVPMEAAAPEESPDLPQSTMIGAQCPVGCTCFPNSKGSGPTQVCGQLDNGTMFKCPDKCCQPTCLA